MVKLKNPKVFCYESHSGSYLIVGNWNAGTPSRYTVIANMHDEPKVIGRELPLTLARKVMREYDTQIERAWKNIHTGRPLAK